MNKCWFLLILVTGGLGGCVLSSKFKESGKYEEQSKVLDVHVAVVGDKDTEQAMRYLGEFLKDSLVANKVKATERYHCCRDKDTDMNELIPTMMPLSYRPPHVLTVVISKVVIGYGTTSSRELQVDLFNTELKKRTWSGKVTVDMSWFLSEQDYRNVAGSLAKAIMAELKKKKIV